MVTLDGEVAACRASIVRPYGELARLHFCFPVRAGRLVLEQLGAVEPMLHVRTARDDAAGIPFAGGPDDPGRRGVQSERGAGARQPILAVPRIRVVEQLILGGAPVDLLVLLRAAV